MNTLAFILETVCSSLFTWLLLSKHFEKYISCRHIYMQWTLLIHKMFKQFTQWCPDFINSSQLVYNYLDHIITPSQPNKICKFSDRSTWNIFCVHICQNSKFKVFDWSKVVYFKKVLLYVYDQNIIVLELSKMQIFKPKWQCMLCVCRRTYIYAWIIY
jgi:hypothetical protein